MLMSHDDARRLVVPLSASDREQQRQAYIAAVDEMARNLKATIAVLNATTQAMDDALLRLSVAESEIKLLSIRVNLILHASIWRRVCWLVAGR